MITYTQDGENFIFTLEQDGMSLPFEAWQRSDRRVFRALQYLVDNGYAEICGNSVKVPYKNIYQLDEYEKRVLCLPPLYPFDVYVKRNKGNIPTPDFSYSYLFYDFAPYGTPFVLLSKKGPIVNLQFSREDNVSQEYILSKEQYNLLSAIDEFNAIPAEKKTIYGNYSKFAEIKELSSQSAALMEKFFAEKTVVLPEHIKIHIEYDSDSGEMQIIPQIENVPEGQESQKNAKFLKIFDTADEVRPAYPISLEKGKITQVIIPPDQIEPLKKIKHKYRRTRDRNAISQIIDNPENILGSNEEKIVCEHSLENADSEKMAAYDGLDLSELYSNRVIDIGIYKPKFYPFIAPFRSEWLPAYQIESRGGTINVLFDNELELEEFLNEIKKAKEENKTTIDYRGNPIAIETAEEIANAAAEKFKEMASKKFNSAKTVPNNTVPDNKETEHQNDREKTVEKPDKVLIIHGNEDNLNYSEYEKKEKALQKLDFLTDEFLNKGIYLKKHQRTGIAWLQNLFKNMGTVGNRKQGGALLADDMGLGKTLQILYFIDWHYRNSADKKPYLVVAPVSLLENWKREYERFFCEPRLPIRIISRIDKEYNAKLVSELSAQCLCLASYETVRRGQLNIAAIDFAVVVLDEAQKAKTPGTQITNAVKALKADFKVAMTGTPIENSFVDLWCIMDFAVPGLLDSAKKFASEYQTKRTRKTEENMEAYQNEIQEKGEKLRSKIDRYFLRRLKTLLASELPKKESIRKKLEMPLEQRIIYRQAVESGRKAEQNDMLSIIAAIRLISDHPYIYLKNWQECSDDMIIKSSAKLMLTIGFLEEIRERNEKAIVFAERKETQKLLQHIISSKFCLDVRIINGDTQSISTGRNRQSRQGIIDTFENTEGFNIIVMSPLACGTGLNITGANNVIHYSRHWNPAKEQQATDRAYRIGQTKDVNVYYPMATLPGSDSFDIVLDRLLEAKTSLSQAALYPSDQMEVSVKDVCDQLFGQAKISAAEPESTGNNKDIPQSLSMDDIDGLNEYLFEALLAEIYRRKGYEVILTPRSGDKGIDVIAEQQGGECIAIQCKHTSKQQSMHQQCVQEAVSGANYYSYKYGKQYRPCVASNAEFSKAAIDFAANTNTIIIDRKKLFSMPAGITMADIVRMESGRILKNI
ncbi:MAG: restriction endonuclease [Elusimicrobiales bacterium]|nr:restriction endonuclease [Elusimicrobiales bacterium]